MHSRFFRFSFFSPRGLFPLFAIALLLLLPRLTRTASRVYYLQGYPGDIYRVNVNGTGDTKISPDAKNGNFDISLDQTKIVYPNMAGNNWNIYVGTLTAKGISNASMVYNGPNRDEDARFSPDAKRVVFKTNQYGVALGNANVADIVVLTLATGSLIKITNNTNMEAWAPCFSPDGKTVAFTMTTNLSVGDASHEIYLAPADGSGPLKRITNNNYDDWFPGFTSSGNLLYISKKQPACDDDIYRIDKQYLTASNPEVYATRLTSSINQCNMVSDADPYGSRTMEDELAFVSIRNGARNYGIYLANKNTGNVSLVIQKTSSSLLGPVLI